MGTIRTAWFCAGFPGLAGSRPGGSAWLFMISTINEVSGGTAWLERPPARCIVSSVNDIDRLPGRRRGAVLDRNHSGAAQAAPLPGPEGASQGPGQAGAADLFTAISVLRRTARRAAHQAWTHQPLPPAQAELLRLAAARPGITVADAAQELRLAPNTVSTLVGRLAGAGLLNRARSSQDGRTVLLTTTQKAERRRAEFLDLRAELAGRALATMPGSDQQALAAAVPALLRLAEHMETT
jgi:DNA-binding MarR family transcriptional regulator